MTIFQYYNQNKINSKYKNISLNKFKENKFNNYYKAKNNNLIQIYIGGAVKNPGNFNVEKNLTIQEILNRYIILKQSADLTNINLNKKLNPKDKLIIPK